MKKNNLAEKWKGQCEELIRTQEPALLNQLYPRYAYTLIRFLFQKLENQQSDGVESLFKQIVTRDNERKNTASFSYDSILHFAIRYGTRDIVERLIEYGANVNCQGVKGNTPLHTAFFSNRKEMISLLFFNLSTDITIVNEMQKRTPIEVATRHSLNELLYNDSEPQEPLLFEAVYDSSDKTNPSIDVRYKSIDEVNGAIKEGANINAQDTGGWTPLVWAIALHNDEMLKLLLLNGARIDLCDHQEKTLLHHAIFSLNDCHPINHQAMATVGWLIKSGLPTKHREKDLLDSINDDICQSMCKNYRDELYAKIHRLIVKIIPEPSYDHIACLLYTNFEFRRWRSYAPDRDIFNNKEDFFSNKGIIEFTQGLKNTLPKALLSVWKPDYVWMAYLFFSPSERHKEALLKRAHESSENTEGVGSKRVCI